MKTKSYKTITAVLLGSVLFFFGIALAAETLSAFAVEKSNKSANTPNIVIKKTGRDTLVDSSDLHVKVQDGKFFVWSYQAAHTGSMDVTNVRVSDDQLEKIDCPLSALTSVESMTCGAESEYDIFKTGQDEHQGSSSSDHVIANDTGVMVTTTGDCDSGI